MNQQTYESLFQTVGQYLLDEERNLETIDDSVYWGIMDGDHMSWKIMVRIVDEEEIRRIQVFSFLPIKVPAGKRDEMAKLFARFNHDLGIGSWNLDFEDGEMSYNASIDLMDGVLTALMFERLFAVNLSIVDKYASTILSVMSGGAKPEDAFLAFQAMQQEGSLQ